MSIKLGIMGGIGSGKSVVSHILRIMGVPIYSTDDEAKRLIQEDPELRSQLIATVGSEVYFPDGSLNKTFMAAYLFASKEHARQINGIIHPCVKKDFIRWAEMNQSHPVVAVESALLIEAGLKDVVDKVVLVSAPIELRVHRAMRRDNASEEQIRKRILQQMDDERQKDMADVILTNDEITPLIPQVLQLLQSISCQ